MTDRRPERSLQPRSSKLGGGGQAALPCRKRGRVSKRSPADSCAKAGGKSHAFCRRELCGVSKKSPGRRFFPILEERVELDEVELLMLRIGLRNAFQVTQARAQLHELNGRELVQDAPARLLIVLDTAVGPELLCGDLQVL